MVRDKKDIEREGYNKETWRAEEERETDKQKIERQWEKERERIVFWTENDKIYIKFIVDFPQYALFSNNSDSL